MLNYYYHFVSNISVASRDSSQAFVLTESSFPTDKPRRKNNNRTPFSYCSINDLTLPFQPVSKPFSPHNILLGDMDVLDLLNSNLLRVLRITFRSKKHGPKTFSIPDSLKEKKKRNRKPSTLHSIAAGHNSRCTVGMDPSLFFLSLGSLSWKQRYRAREEPKNAQN